MRVQALAWVFSCGWYITRDGQDVYSRRFSRVVRVVNWLAHFEAIRNVIVINWVAPVFAAFLEGTFLLVLA